LFARYAILGGVTDRQGKNQAKFSALPEIFLANDKTGGVQIRLIAGTAYGETFPMSFAQG
jgi:hypothetical protein